MNTVKKYLGIVWILLAAAMAFFSIEIFGGKLSSGKQDDLVFGIIIFFFKLNLIKFNQLFSCTFYDASRIEKQMKIIFDDI